MMTQRQQDLFTDLPRGEQLSALRKLKIATYIHKGRKVSGAIQKATLRAIDDHQGRGDCFASQLTLADEVGVGTTAIGLAIAALIAQDFITADRPHRMAPNRHRVVWSSIFQANREEPRNTHSVERDPPGVERDTPSGDPTHAQRVQNAPINANLNAPTNRPDEWEALAVDLFRWGLGSAPSTVQAARDRGLSIEYVRELWLSAGGDREPERWEPGQLANWITGRTPAPFDASEVQQRQRSRQDAQAAAQDARERQDAAEAEKIRRRARFDAKGRNVPEVKIHAVTRQRLAAAGLERFASDAEIAAKPKRPPAPPREDAAAMNEPRNEIARDLFKCAN